MNYQNLIVELEEEIGVVKVNRPKQLNSLSNATFLELDQALRELDENAQVLVVIVTGEGKAFVAGADIEEMRDMTAKEARNYSQLGQRVFSLIEAMEKPVIAAVNGYALGGGCEFALACDLRVASDRAKFGQPEVNLGVTPGFAGTQRLPRLIGMSRAKEMILTGDIIDAQTALSYGLVNGVFPSEDLMRAAKELARKIAGKGPTAIRLAKAAINRGSQADVATGSAYETEGFGVCFSTGQAKEGMAAFLEKRPPRWK